MQAVLYFVDGIELNTNADLRVFHPLPHKFPLDLDMSGFYFDPVNKNHHMSLPPINRLWGD